MLVRIEGRKATVINPMYITSGSVGMTVPVCFDSVWQNTTKTAIFKGSGETISVLESSWPADDRVPIPWETVADSGGSLQFGVYGTIGDDIVIPTIWVDLGRIRKGADPTDADEGADPTLPVWAQLQADMAALQSAMSAYTVPDDSISAAVTTYMAAHPTATPAQVNAVASDLAAYKVTVASALDGKAAASHTHNYQAPGDYATRSELPTVPTSTINANASGLAQLQTTVAALSAQLADIDRVITEAIQAAGAEV